MKVRSDAFGVRSEIHKKRKSEGFFDLFFGLFSVLFSPNSER